MTIYATAKKIYNRIAVMFKLYTSKDFRQVQVLVISEARLFKAM
jgi:hypothetical protein